MEQQGVLTATWGSTDSNRQAKFYALTVAGRRRLEDETAHWTRMATAIGRVLEAFSSPRWDAEADLSGERERTEMNDDLAPLIQLQDVSKVFHTDEVETHALDQVSLAIHPGEYIAISGPSGCGKSTLLSILGLLDTPTAGDYTLNGYPVAQLRQSDRARTRNREIGFIFQSFNLIGDLTVYENVELPLTYRGMRPAERRERVEQALEKVEMAHRTKHLPSQLSGGQQQRVAVARAVAGQPSILLADEPTGNLDSKNGEAVMGLLRTLHDEGSTICMVTHDPRYAEHAQQREIHLFDGRMGGA